MKCVMTVDIRRPFSEVNECMMDGDVGEYVHSSVAVPLFDAVDDFIFCLDAGLPTDDAVSKMREAMLNARNERPR